MMEASSRGGVRTWPNQVVTPSSSILHLSWKWNILHLHQKMESFKRRSASLIPLQWMLGAHRQLTGYYLRHAKVGAMTATSIVYYWKRVRTPSSKTRPLLQVWEQFPPIISTRVQPRPKGCAHTVDIWQLKSQPRPKGRNLEEKHLRLAPQGAHCLSYIIAKTSTSASMSTST